MMSPAAPAASAVAAAPLRTPPSSSPSSASHGWQRAFRDLPREHGFEPLTIEGTLPAGLRGTLYRNGPGLLGSFGERYRHWFDGDGAVSAVRFDGGGGAAGAVRLVDSRGRQEERRRGRRWYAGYNTPAPSWWRGLMIGLTGDLKNSANTSVMIWQGRLYALVESSLPTEIDVGDLTTLGERDLGGVLVHNLSAHPHYVPQRRSAYNFGVRYGKQTLLDVYALPDEGAARRMTTIALAGATMIHDFIATERHLVFFAPPLRLRLFRMLAGIGAFGDNLRWQPGEGTEIIVVPIDQPEAARRFTAPAFFQWHFADAHERGDEIVVDYVRYDDFASHKWLGEVMSGPTRTTLDGQLHRAVIDPARGRLTDEPLASLPGGCEFPRVARPASDSRIVYLAAYSDREAGRGMFDRLARVDVPSGAVTRVDLGEARYPSEPVFVRRPDGRAEDDGWLLSLVYDARADKSGIAVLDAAALDRGAVAWAWFDHALPFTFHGNFAR